MGLSANPRALPNLPLQTPEPPAPSHPRPPTLRNPRLLPLPPRKPQPPPRTLLRPYHPPRMSPVSSHTMMPSQVPMAQRPATPTHPPPHPLRQTSSIYALSPTRTVPHSLTSAQTSTSFPENSANSAVTPNISAPTYTFYPMSFASLLPPNASATSHIRPSLHALHCK